MNIKYYFKLWRSKVQTFKKYDEWCELYRKEIDEWCELYREEEYAMNNGMDSVHWCWNCKYSDCDIHSQSL